MRSRQELLRLLRSLGYNYVQLHAPLAYENGKIVLVFSVPYGAKRRALTAFITDQQDRPPQVEVEPGFVVEQGSYR